MKTEDPPFDIVKIAIDAAFQSFQPGIYRHYKGPLYRAIGLVAHHETRKPWVLYVSLKKGSMNIRPLMSSPEEPDGWLDAVEVRVETSSIGAAIVRYQKVPRFLLIDATLDGIEDP